MAATPSLLIKVQVLEADGTPKITTNRYHFSGGLPADNAHWTTFADAVVAKLALALPPLAEIVGAVGYPAGSNVAVFTKAYTTAGTVTLDSGNGYLPPFCCALLRWSTSARTTKNHPIYLFSYVHGVLSRNDSNEHAGYVGASQVTALQAFVDQWWNAGFSDGANTYKRAGPNGVTAIGGTCEIIVKDHDLSPR